MKGLRATLFVGLALALALGARAQGPASELGRIDFRTSGSPEAQKRFLRGALLLHSFEYDDAAEEFREAERIEPGFAMAYWGEAMTHNHPLWMEQDHDAARKVLERLAPTREARLAKAPTRREKMYLEAVEALYGGGDKPERDRAYAEAMRRLHEAFPEDLDAASLYALSLLGTCEGKRDVPTYMKAAAIAEEVFAKNPLHPGAVHYLIHCYDDPAHAPLGMRAALVYAKIAPAAGHALHMPSHIFFASGMWDEAAASNEAAWKASLERAERKKLGPDDHNYHALFWLEYAYLQQGRYRDARRTLAAMEEDVKKSGSSRARSSLASMRAAYLVETRQCAGDVARIPVEPAGQTPSANELFVTGFCALQGGNLAGAEEALAGMKTSKKDGGPAHTHGGAMAYAMGGRGRGVDGVLEKELEAEVLLARGERERAVALAEEAAAGEDGMSFEFGPPAVVKPAHELVGEMLLALGRPAEARKEFETALSRAPKRALSLLGLARAAAKAGEPAVARQAYGELAGVWHRADADLAELPEARGASVPGS